MKICVALFLVLLVSSCQGKDQESKQPAPNSAEVKVKLPGEKEEDCDKKAKEPIEIKPESISLSGNTGCSLDESETHK